MRATHIVVRSNQENRSWQGPKNCKNRNRSCADPTWLTAVRAAESKQARDIVVLDVREETSFSDYFLVCTGANTRQIQAIADEIGLKMRERGEYSSSIEGYKNAEWVLLDYGDFVVHVFSPKARIYYDLERLWRDAHVVSNGVLIAVSK